MNTEAYGAMERALREVVRVEPANGTRELRFVMVDRGEGYEVALTADELVREVRDEQDAETEAGDGHRMIAGSHERLGGPECKCGCLWSRWDNACTSQLSRLAASPGDRESGHELAERDDERRWDIGNALGWELEDRSPSWRDVMKGIADLREMAVTREAVLEAVRDAETSAALDPSIDVALSTADRLGLTEGNRKGEQ